MAVTVSVPTCHGALTNRLTPAEEAPRPGKASIAYGLVETATGVLRQETTIDPAKVERLLEAVGVLVRWLLSTERGHPQRLAKAMRK